MNRRTLFARAAAALCALAAGRRVSPGTFDGELPSESHDPAVVAWWAARPRWEADR